MSNQTGSVLPYLMTLEHKDVLKFEQELFEKRTGWTTHEPLGYTRSATLCFCIPFTWCHFKICKMELCYDSCCFCCPCYVKRFKGTVHASYKMISVEDKTNDSVCCAFSQYIKNDRMIADVTGMPKINVNSGKNSTCCGAYSVEQHEYDIVIPTSQGDISTGLLTNLSGALSSLWPAWTVVSKAPWIEMATNNVNAKPQGSE